jgi:hypothetical protein
VDDDIAFTRDDFDRICTHPHHVIGGLYVKRNMEQAGVYVPLDHFDQREGDIERVKYIGTGFLKVTRKAIEGMQEAAPLVSFGGNPPIPHLFEAGGYAGAYLSEDYAFCRLAKKQGFGPHVDHSIKVGHAGQHTFRP